MMHRRVIELTEDDRRFIKITPLEKLPDSFLAEVRCRRLGMTLSSFKAMRIFDQARELADERAIIGLENTEYIAPIRLDDGMIDVLVKIESLQRARDWQEFLEAKRAMQ